MHLGGTDTKGGTGVETLPSPKYWRVSARRIRAAGGLQEHKDPALVDNQLPMVAPPWGSYLEGLGHKRPFQPPTSSESVNQCTNTNVISHPAGTYRKISDPLGFVQVEVYCPTNTATPITWEMQEICCCRHQQTSQSNMLLKCDHKQIKFRPSWTTGNSKCWCLGASVVSEHCHRYSQDMMWSVRNVNGFSGSSKSCGVTGGSRYTMA